MRITNPEEYIENRDTIANDWSEMFLKYYNDIDWIYLPNIGEDIIEYIKTWELNGFILTGGENIGTNNSRDITENAIIEYASSKNYPLLGICRGMQLIYQYYGGEIAIGDNNFSDFHVAKKHLITFYDETIQVNSYHNNYLIDKSKPIDLKIIGRSVHDDSIEAFVINNNLGLMWHPERKLGQQIKIINHIRSFFKFKN